MAEASTTDGSEGTVEVTQTAPVTPVTEQGKKPETPGDQIVLTPAQLAERLQRKEESAAAALLKKLGVSSVDDLETSIKELQALKEAQLSEQEKRDKALAEAKAEAEQLRSKAEAASAEALQNSLVLKAYELMGKMETPFADQVAALRLMDLSTVTQDGAVDVDALQKVINETASAHPWALKQRGAVTPPSGATTPGTPPDGESDDAKRARYFGAVKQQGGFFTPGAGGVVTPE